MHGFEIYSLTHYIELFNWNFKYFSIILKRVATRVSFYTT